MHSLPHKGILTRTEPQLTPTMIHFFLEATGPGDDRNSDAGERMIREKYFTGFA